MSTEQSEEATPSPPCFEWYEENVPGFGVIFNSTASYSKARVLDAYAQQVVRSTEIQHLGAWLPTLDTDEDQLCLPSEFPDWLSVTSEVTLDDCTQYGDQTEWQASSLDSGFAGTPEWIEYDQDQDQYEEWPPTKYDPYLLGIPESGPWSTSSQTPQSLNGSPKDSDIAQLGYQNSDGTWSCGHPGCRSKYRLARKCDLRKHSKRHTSVFFCRRPDCARSADRGFASKKDRERHEAKHNPNVACEWRGCARVFSRQDNMRDHMRRMHCRESP